MQVLERFLKFIGILAIIMLFFAVKIFIGIAIISLAVVPITGLYCYLSGRSYNSTIDSSQVVYLLNKMGQYSYIALAGLGVFYLVFKF